MTLAETALLIGDDLLGRGALAITGTAGACPACARSAVGGWSKGLRRARDPRLYDAAVKVFLILKGSLPERSFVANS